MYGCSAQTAKRKSEHLSTDCVPQGNIKKGREPGFIKAESDIEGEKRVVRRINL